MRRRLGIALLTLAVLSPACTDGGDDEGGEPDPEPALAGADESSWQQALDGIGDDGLYDKDAALVLFEVAFGGMPGVEVPDGPAEDVSSGTMALRSLLAHEDELTDEQRARLEEVLRADGAAPEEGDGGDEGGLPADDSGGVEVRLASTAGSTTSTTAAPSTRQSDVIEAVDEVRGELAERLGPLDDKVTVSFRSVQDAKTLAATGPAFLAEKYGYEGCNIRVYPLALDGRYEIHPIMRHELVHCYQYAAVPDDAVFRLPMWILEGSAEWIAAALTPDAEFDPVLRSRWERYLFAPDKELDRRNYDAMPFFARLDEVVGDAWEIIPKLWVAGLTTPAAFNTTGADTPAFLETWASSMLRRPEYGGAWFATGPAAFGQGRVIPLAVARGPVPFEAESLAAPLYGLRVFNDVLEISLGMGTARLGDGSLDTTEVAGRFCMRLDGCKCPNGGPTPPRPLNPDTAILAVTGHADGAVGELRAMSLAEHCDPEKRPEGEKPACPPTILPASLSAVRDERGAARPCHGAVHATPSGAA